VIKQALYVFPSSRNGFCKLPASFTKSHCFAWNRPFCFQHLCFSCKKLF